MSFNDVIKIVEASRWWTVFVDLKKNPCTLEVVFLSGPSDYRIVWVVFASSLRNEIYLNNKLRMDQALLTILGKWNKWLRFDSIATDGDCRAQKEECTCQSTETQTNKLRTPSVCKMDTSFKITVKYKCIHLTGTILNLFSRSCQRISMIYWGGHCDFRFWSFGYFFRSVCTPKDFCFLVLVFIVVCGFFVL